MMQNQKKQQTLLLFLGNSSNKRKVANKLDAEQKTVEDIQIQLVCMSTLEHIVFSIEQLDQSGNKKTVHHCSVTTGRAELNWTSKAVIIFFYLHDLLGNRNLDMIAEIFKINVRTLEGWITKSEFKKNGGVWFLTFHLTMFWTSFKKMLGLKH